MVNEEHRLTSFYERQNQESYMIYSYAKHVYSGITYIPKVLVNSSAQVIDNMNTRLIEEQEKRQAHTIRYPRFTSSTMQLEPYNHKKAYALKKLNDINLNMLQTESILKLYTLDHYVVLVTAKRIICVEDFGSEKQTQREEIITSRAGSTTSLYKHWNIFFDDILKIKEMKI